MKISGQMYRVQYLSGVFLSLLYHLTFANKVMNPTYMLCSDEIFAYSSAHCYEDCNVPLITQEKKTYSIHSIDHPQELLFGICQRIRRTTVLTELWTFSRIEPIIKTEIIPVTKEECLYQWERNCRSSQCLVKEPAPPMEYSYASTITTVDEYILLDISKSASNVQVGEMSFIVTPDGLSEYTSQYAPMKDGSAYIWEYRPDITSPCNLKPEGSVDCYDTDEDDKFICPKLGITVNKKDAIPISACGKPLYRHGGIFLEEALTNTGHIDDIDMMASESLRFLFTSIRDMILEQEGMVCFKACANLGSTSIGSFVILKTKIIKKRGDSKYSECKVLPHCSLIWPITICQGTKKVQIMCGSVKLWWDGERGAELVPTICKPGEVQADNIELDLGGELLLINQTGYFWRESVVSSGELLLPFSYKKIHHLKEYKDQAMATVSSRLRADLDTSSSSVNRSFDIERIIGGIGRWFDRMKFIFTGIGATSMILLVWYLIIKLVGLRPQKRKSMTRVGPTDNRSSEDTDSSGSVPLVYQS